MSKPLHLPTYISFIAQLEGSLNLFYCDFFGQLFSSYCHYISCRLQIALFITFLFMFKPSCFKTKCKALAKNFVLPTRRLGTSQVVRERSSWCIQIKFLPSLKKEYMAQSRPLFLFIFVFSTCHNLN